MEPNCILTPQRSLASWPFLWWPEPAVRLVIRFATVILTESFPGPARIRAAVHLTLDPVTTAVIVRISFEPNWPAEQQAMPWRAGSRFLPSSLNLLVENIEVFQNKNMSRARSMSEITWRCRQTQYLNAAKSILTIFHVTNHSMKSACAKVTKNNSSKISNYSFKSLWETKYTQNICSDCYSLFPFEYYSVVFHMAPWVIFSPRALDFGIE